MTIVYTIHQDDGTGRCTACGTEWPGECAVEKNARWVAEVAPSAESQFGDVVCCKCGHSRHIGRCHADVDRENRCTCDTFKGRPEENQFIGRQPYTLEALPTLRSKMWGER